MIPERLSDQLHLVGIGGRKSTAQESSTFGRGTLAIKRDCRDFPLLNRTGSACFDALQVRSQDGTIVVQVGKESRKLCVAGLQGAFKRNVRPLAAAKSRGRIGGRRQDRQPCNRAE